jgi:hypothetical protein
MSDFDLSDSMRDVFEKYEFLNQPEKTFNFGIDMIAKMYHVIVILENGSEIQLTAKEMHSLIVEKTTLEYDYVSIKMFINYGEFIKEMKKRASYLLT